MQFKTVACSLLIVSPLAAAFPVKQIPLSPAAAGTDMRTPKSPTPPTPHYDSASYEHTAFSPPAPQSAPVSPLLTALSSLASRAHAAALVAKGIRAELLSSAPEALTATTLHSTSAGGSDPGVVSTRAHDLAALLRRTGAAAADAAHLLVAYSPASPAEEAARDADPALHDAYERVLLRLNDAVSATDAVLEGVRGDREVREAWQAMQRAGEEAIVAAEKGWRRECGDMHALAVKLVGKMVGVGRRMGH